MGFIFKSFLILVLILLFFALFELTFTTGFIANLLIKRMENLVYVFELRNNYKTQVSILEQQNISDIFLGVTVDNLEFGEIPVNSVIRRFLNLDNKDEIDYKVLLIVSGNISPMISFDKNDFILPKENNMTVTVILDSSIAPKPGNYTGEVSVLSKKPRFLFLSSFMEES